MTATDLLAQGRHAAFHGAPVVGIAPLQALIATSDDPQVQDEARWLLAVCQGASGLYGSALTTLAHSSDTNAFTGHGHLVAASIHRQLGHFDTARRHDEQAEHSATASVRCEALIGQAADAVGLGAVDAAGDHLAAASGTWQPEWWREGIRLQWVGAELALLADEAESALPGLRDALDVASAHDAPRHVAKTQGFLSVALHSAFPDDPVVRSEALNLLSRAGDAAQLLAAWPLVWAFRRIEWLWLRELLGAGPEAARAREQATRAVVLILSDVPADMRPGFRRRPDVVDLLPYDG